LDGAWDFMLTFSLATASTTAQTNSAAVGETPAAATPDGRVTLFEALESQLGLKIETTKVFRTLGDTNVSARKTFGRWSRLMSAFCCFQDIHGHKCLEGNCLRVILFLRQNP
jgi:hypothetical protein